MTVGSLACGYAADTDNTAIDTTSLYDVGAQGWGSVPPRHCEKEEDVERDLKKVSHCFKG